MTRLWLKSVIENRVKFLERNAVFPSNPLLPDDLAELSEHDHDDHAGEGRADDMLVSGHRAWKHELHPVKDLK